MTRPGSSTERDYAPDPRPEPPVRFDAAFRAVEAVLLKVEAASRRALPDPVNPLLHSGAVANVLLLIACATGVLLLFWYSPSAHHAHASMRELEASFLGRFVRAAHRYSSDGCIAFVAWHALKLTAARRFGGARWLAWVTGLTALTLLWLIGWLGYWLVWDEPARQVALGTARVLDVLPIFADPIARTFVADSTINSLLFFIVFFAHMLIPLAMGIALWLHIARLQRSDFLTPRKVTVVLAGATALLSLVLPPLAAAPARMANVPGRLAVDAWYLTPLWLTDRLGGGALWAISLGLFGLALSVPWLLAKQKPKPAEIVASRCNACNNCVADCPYDAISLVPRTDGRPFDTQAQVDPSRCVGCGICAGSCASGGSGLPQFDMLRERARLEQWIEEQPEGRQQHVALVCDDAVSRSLDIDPGTGACTSLPGYRVMRVPCAGWVNAITLERALRQGVPGVLVVACSGCRYREGPAWTSERLGGSRSPELSARVERSKVRLVTVDRTAPGRLTAEARAFREGIPLRPRRVLPAAAGAALACAVAAGAVWGGQTLPYSPPQPDGPSLVLSFRHAGKIEERCRTVSEEENAKRPVHMRRPQECSRGRQGVRVELEVDGRPAFAKSFGASGLWADGPSVGLERLPVPPGRHRVAVRLDDSGEPGGWAFTDERELELGPRESVAIVFGRETGFQWHQGP
ncbi:MAG: hydrogenase iron-sulfur subunit [Archangiaceae bacterium]|nr:hydrogenase iron-sulfur subunit [Archangiaceae bacterium]